VDDRNQALTEVIRKCSLQDQKSQEKLYRHFFGYAMSVALLYCKERDDALTAVNDSFIKVFAEIEQFDDTRTFRSWFRKIIVNRAIDLLRKKRRYLFFEDDPTLQPEDQQAGVVSQMTAAELMELLHQLPGMMRIIFILYEVEGYRHEEISQKLHIPVSSSRVYLSRAKMKLRALWPLYFDIHHGRLEKR